MPLNRRQLRLYMYTCCIVRPVTGAVDPDTLDPAPGTYILVDQHVLYYPQLTPNLDDATGVGRVKRPTEFTTDFLHFASDQDVQNADYVIDTTPGSFITGQVHRILGASRNTPGFGRRRTNKQEFDAQIDEHPPADVLALVPSAGE